MIDEETGKDHKMKDASSPRSSNTRSSTSYCLPFLCAAAVLLVICLGLVTIPYLGFSPQLLLEEGDAATPDAISTYVLTVPTADRISSLPLQKDNESHGDASAECHLFKGQWVYDDRGPLYRNDSCRVLSQAQNCQGNGRPDRGYENWRWAPDDCSLPRFNATAFLKLMRGKVITFVGDSVSRNQMESLMCILIQAETPVNKGNRKMQKWYFSSHSVTIVRIWSSWLVRTSSLEFENVPSDATKLHLEFIDDKFSSFLPDVDVLVISSGHWFTKKTAFVIGDRVVGSQGWSNPKTPQELNSKAAFAISMKTALNALATLPDYSGLTILRTYSPDHYEGGSWNTGGSCTGKTKPLPENEVFDNPFTNLMRKLQVDAYTDAARNVSNGSKMRLLDVTRAFMYRADGHPGPYRNQEPNKRTLRGPDGKPPPQDCLHWCMPGPIDTWNELLFALLRQEVNS